MVKRKSDNVEGAKTKVPKVETSEDNSGIKLDTENNHNGHIIEDLTSTNTGQDDDNSQEEDSSGNEDTVDRSGPPKKQKSQLTAQDIQVARETAELFKSNIFKLQIDELMKEVKVKKSHEEVMEKVLHRLHDLIKEIPSAENLSLQEAEGLFNHKRVAIPFPDPKPTNVKYSFSYGPPEDLSLVGSYGLKTGISQGSSIDVALTMPRSIFQPKDYLNYRALHKRAFYLAYLADHLIPLTKKNNLPVKITYTYFNDDVLCPILHIESIQTENPDDLIFFKTRYKINLIPAFPFTVFESKKLLPDKNCIRIQSESEELPPTPLYNSSILMQSSYDYYLKFLYSMKKSTESFKDACILGRLWLQQRGFNSTFSGGGFGHFEFAILLSALLHGGGLNGNKILLSGFSSYQLFKGAVKYLATMDLNSGYLSFSSEIGEFVPAKYKPEGFNVPTLFDKNTKINILWKMTPASYEELKSKAIQTLDLLNDVVKDRFDPILLQKSNVDFLKFDILLSMTIDESSIETFGPLEKIRFITFDNYIKSRFYNLMKKALGDRVTIVSVWKDKVKRYFSIHKRKPTNPANNWVIGLQLNPDECDKVVTKGPDNEEKEKGAAFRSFWGSKASLRRFKDGSVQHCVVWNVSDREPLVVSIIKYAMDVHVSTEVAQSIHTECGLYEKKLPLSLLSTTSNQVSHSLSSYTILRNSFDNMTKALINLNLPLSIKSVLPTSSSLRYASLLQPVPFAVSNPDYWNDCVIQFEISTRWPDELKALEKTKTALLLKVSEMLRTTEYSTFITSDDSIPFNEDVCLLNILTPEGFGFRLRVLTERDEVLYLRAVSNADKQKPIAQDVYVKFIQKYQASSKHTRTITQLAQHFPYYSPTVRLVKQWLDSQLLSSHFNDELVELITLKPFVDPAPYSIPHSVENGFLQVLFFLANWNWRDTPLILDVVKSTAEADSTLSDRLTIQAYRVIEQNFNKIRGADPTGIKTQFFVGSKDDPSGILWSSNLTLPIAARLTALARAATTLLASRGNNESFLDLIFTPALKDYDFVLEVKSQNLTTSSGILPTNAFKNLVEPLTSYPDDISSKRDFIQAFYMDLEKKFGNAIIFSTRKFTGLCKDNKNVIGGLFVPSNLSKKKFRTNLGINVKPDGDKEEVILNKEAIFDQMKLLGQGLDINFTSEK
ncbi:Utp22 U3 snoRNP protein [Candida orthopsilosis Co 90-125]|uniref:U3 small nucleolar RNA-associated protein 22 n=1 Tax=Candida orthopsilosis (strain 90-125) TaxID=1136231 RepID=H8WXY6_CANO9|nr:Utp22 U3 snoRNP protein [Candida orthopsilosis Co 90-125]CCG20933.1 Utp22 U3 snoRNP protein [Candida orthopsilosis Co 90-125]